MKFIKKDNLENYIEKDVISFLTERNIYDKFLFNLREWIKSKDEKYAICLPITINSFKWSATPEQGNLWYNLNIEYSKIHSVNHEKPKIISIRELKDLIK